MANVVTLVKRGLHFISEKMWKIRLDRVDKRFALFNATRWAARGAGLEAMQGCAPECCDVVPILYRGPFSTEQIEYSLGLLQGRGSNIAPGFMSPEGVVIYHTASGALFKKTILHDAVPKLSGP